MFSKKVYCPQCKKNKKQVLMIKKELSYNTKLNFLHLKNYFKFTCPVCEYTYTRG